MCLYFSQPILVNSSSVLPFITIILSTGMVKYPLTFPLLSIVLSNNTSPSKEIGISLNSSIVTSIICLLSGIIYSPIKIFDNKVLHPYHFEYYLLSYLFHQKNKYLP